MYSIPIPPPDAHHGRQYSAVLGSEGVINTKETQTNFYDIHLMPPRPGQHHPYQPHWGEMHIKNLSRGMGEWVPLFNLELLQDFCCFTGLCQRLQTMLLLIGLFLVSSCLYGKLECRVPPNKRVISRHFGQRVVLGEIKEAAVGGPSIAASFTF